MAAVAETLAADAEDRPLQVMMVFRGAIPTDAVAVKHLLHLIEGCPVDEGLVASFALRAVVGDDPCVVVVTEHAVDHASGHRFPGPLVTPSRTQASALKDVGDRSDGVIAGSYQIKRHLDIGNALLVYGNRCDLAPANVFTHVEVADAGHPDCAAVEELAFKADLDLLTITPRAEGVEAGHDPVHQHPR
ncbi:MAG TPA: hypothetical protein VIH92_03035 [Solirubrobacteraceae bacterium]